MTVAIFKLPSNPLERVDETDRPLDISTSSVVVVEDKLAIMNAAQLAPSLFHVYFVKLMFSSPGSAPVLCVFRRVQSIFFLLDTRIFLSTCVQII